MIKIRNVLWVSALTAAATVSMAWTAEPAAAHNPTRSSAADGSTWRGSIAKWRVLADGTVAVQLSGEFEGQSEKTCWFATPASRTATTNFEDLVLEAVIGVISSRSISSKVVIHSDDSNEQSGKTVEDARTITSIGGSV